MNIQAEKKGVAEKRRLCAFSLVMVAALLFLFSGCGSNGHTVSPAFYYWKTVFRMEPEAAQQLEALEVKKIYLRCFDVEWNDVIQEVKIVAPVRVLDELPAGTEIIPVVFIENEVMRKAAPATRNELAGALFSKTDQLLEGQKLHELQVDCDWTPGTREAYFSFLDSLTALQPDRKLSVTIRLGQVRDREGAGIPPVERGMLMAYNLQSPADLLATNSILELDLLKGYAKTLPTYPLELDIALPLFSWGIVFQENQFKGLIDNLREADLEAAEGFKKISEHTWEARKNTYIQSQYIRKGEQIKVESMEMDQLKAAAQLLSRQVANDTLTVSLFHFAPEVMRNYPNNEVESLFEVFR